MGPATCAHIFFGSVLGWAILSPLAALNQWVTGPADDAETGSRGWVMWISLSILLADTLVNLCWLLVRHIIQRVLLTRLQDPHLTRKISSSSLNNHGSARDSQSGQCGRFKATLRSMEGSAMLFFAILLCLVCVHLSFGQYLSVIVSVGSALFMLLAGTMTSRALGETDVSPNSGVAKLTQFVFGLLTRSSSTNPVVLNLLVGSMSESGGSQTANLMADFRAAQLLDASPIAQFRGHIVGSIAGAIVSPIVYRLYTSAYDLPTGRFQIPSAYIWIFSARLLTGQGLPMMVPQVASSFALIFLGVTCLRIYTASHNSVKVRRWHAFLPSGVAVAIGMYTLPVFNLPWVLGGLIKWWGTRHDGAQEIKLIVVASGLILGEGLMSLVNLSMEVFQVPHF